MPLCKTAAACCMLALPLYSSHAASALQPFLDTHCMDCHDADVKKGGLDLSALLEAGSSPAIHKKWVQVYDRVLAGEMPPKDEERPAEKELLAFSKTLGADLQQQHQSMKGTVLRRLNRREYENTVNDLLGVEAELMKLLPEDGRAQGFDTIGEALAVSGLQMQRYMEAAELALDTALLAGAKPESTQQSYQMDAGRNAANFKEHWLKLPEGGVVVFNEGGFPSTQVPGLQIKTAGEYRLRITGRGYQSQEPVVFCLITGNFQRGGDNAIHSYHELPASQSQTVEVILKLRAQDGIRISPQGLKGPDGHSPKKDGPDKYPGEGMVFEQITLEGPLVKEWPPRGQPLLLGQAVLQEIPPQNPKQRYQRGYKPRYKVVTADPAAEARAALTRLLPLAFRRPVVAAELEPYMALFTAEFAQESDYLSALRTAAVAVLCSPQFLYLQESAGQLPAHALAARVSYFLTRRAPDAALLQAASTGSLQRDLPQQVQRLLAEPRYLQAFVQDFADGWLNLREIDFTTPDKQLYPEHDGLLQDSMLKETHSFLTTLIRENLSVRNLLHSDFALLNSRLARHYGIAGVTGLQMQKVQLPADSKRGGLLTQASILKVSANGTNTSPVVRGVWVNERLLGIQPTPPPPGIPGVEPDTRGAQTLRELLEKHRSMESCNGCHRVIDPPGFALENYDVIGGWRERFRTLGEGDRVLGRKVRYKLGPPVDAAGQLPSGAAFQNLQQLQQQLLLSSEQQVVRCLVEKLLTFATGREMGFSDRAEISQLLAATQAKGYAMQDVLQAVVGSSIFRSE